MMKKITAILVVYIFYLTALTGCQEYSEVITPLGSVPPVNENQQVLVPPPTHPPAQQQSPALPQTPPLSRKAKGIKETAVKQEVLKRFSEIYHAKGAPRIAVYLNKAVSDEIRQWRTDKKKVVTGEGQKVSVSSSNDKAGDGSSSANINADVVNIKNSANNKDSIELKGSEDKQRTITIQTQQYVENEKRRGPDEQIMWAFDEGFLDTFISAKSNIVDRTIILRLAAEKTDNSGAAQNDGVRHIEMDALSKYADIVMEVLVCKETQNHQDFSANSSITKTASLTPVSDTYSPCRYIFKITAKEVKTGRILASATNADWQGLRACEGRIIATADGYKFDNRLSPAIVKKIASDLAMEVMEKLSDIWE